MADEQICSIDGKPGALNPPLSLFLFVSVLPHVVNYSAMTTLTPPVTLFLVFVCFASRFNDTVMATLTPPLSLSLSDVSPQSVNCWGGVAVG